jgi:hypothetical protein
MRRFFVLTIAGLVFLFPAIPPVSVSAQSHSVSVGYGFGVFSDGRITGHIEEGRYDFLNFAYQYERSLSQVLGLVIEPFASYTIKPKDGVDVGVTLSLKYKFHTKESNGFFLTFGGGSAYTSINFKEQGTHLLFIIQAGVGYKWKNYFIDSRFKHYSNADTAHPNRSINSNIVMVGMVF